jgi:hypothetical protein
VQAQNSVDGRTSCAAIATRPRWACVVAALMWSVPFVASAAHAQSTADVASSVRAALACAPPAEVEVPALDAPRVLGTPDAVGQLTYSARDLIVVGSGTEAGLQLGQQFFIRRPIRFGGSSSAPPVGTATVGWLRIVAVNESTAIASVDHTCDAILQYDYLVPYVEPALPPDDGRDAAEGELDFSSLSHVVGGTDSRQTGSAGDFMIMDRGSDQGLVLGARFAIYRAPRLRTIPLVAIGEATVMRMGATRSIVRITQTRDVVLSGDYLVPRK